MFFKSTLVIAMLIPTTLLISCSPMQRPSLNYQLNTEISADAVNELNSLNAKQQDEMKSLLQNTLNGRKSVVSAFGFENNQDVLDAYNKYIEGESDVVVHSAGFITYPYEEYSRPIINCAPLRVCTIQLQKGEQINNIQIGDASRWTVDKFLTGPSAKNGSWSLAFKPITMTDNLSTDLVISTDKRTYTLGLLSKKGSSTHIVNFYYPNETIEQMNLKTMKEALNRVRNNESISHQNNSKNILKTSTKTLINKKNINKNYSLSGDKPSWTPIKVFDDGVKTFIELPAMASRLAIPVINVINSSGERELINARYKKPYYILDGLYYKIFLTSGTGKHEETVVILNDNINK